MITTDTQRAFLIPDDKRDDYFKIVEAVDSWICRFSGRYDQAIDASNDPIVIFNMEYIPKAIWLYIEKKLEAIGAKDVTETLTIQYQ